MDEIAEPRPDPADIAEAVTHLRSLRFAEDEGLARYLSGKPSEGWHVMVLPGGLQRKLLRGEAYPWALGLADGWGWGHLLDDITARPVPQMLTVVEAAQRLPGIDSSGKRYADHMKPATVDHHIDLGHLYVVWPRVAEATHHQRRRWMRCLFAAQVEAEAAARLALAINRAGRLSPELGPSDELAAASRAAAQARDEWLALRDQLPTYPTALDGVLDERASPDPLPVPPRAQGRDERDRAMAALLIADQQHWLRYQHPTEDRTGFIIDVPGPDGADGELPVRREVPLELVLPYVLGHADRHRAHRRVAYRDGLG